MTMYFIIFAVTAIILGLISLIFPFVAIIHCAKRDELKGFTKFIWAVGMFFTGLIATLIYVFSFKDNPKYMKYVSFTYLISVCVFLASMYMFFPELKTIIMKNTLATIEKSNLDISPSQKKELIANVTQKIETAMKPDFANNFQTNQDAFKELNPFLNHLEKNKGKKISKDFLKKWITITNSDKTSKKEMAKKLKNSDKKIEEDKTMAKEDMTKDAMAQKTMEEAKPTIRKCYQIIEKNYARHGGSNNGTSYYFLANQNSSQEDNNSQYTLYEYNVDTNKVKPKFTVQLGNKNTLNVSEAGAAVYTLIGESAACGTGQGTSVTIGFNKNQRPHKMSGAFAVSSNMKTGYFADLAKKYIYFNNPNTNQKKIAKKITKTNMALLNMNYDSKAITYLTLGENPMLIEEDYTSQTNKYTLRENESILMSDDNTYFTLRKNMEENKFYISRLNSKFNRTKELEFNAPRKVELYNSVMVAMPKYHKLVLQGKNPFVSRIWGGVYYLNLGKKSYEFIEAPEGMIIGKVIPSPNQKFLIAELLNQDYNFAGAGIIDLQKLKFMTKAKLENTQSH